ncbi:MAG: TrmH family RNA methyltransferase [Candidatus Promineifilaceae bacterium]|nr:TrmH family RNA methyltransferase [Candidatus Promineifilaceae bacterium]
MERYQFRQCEWEECQFRFPVQVDMPRANRCPTCGSDTYLVGEPAYVQSHKDDEQTRPAFEALLDNIRSIHNVGSMFRTADGAGISHLHLCGMTATPAHAKLAKAALGAQEKVAWSYSSNGVETAVKLKGRGYALWAIESAPNSQSFFAADHERVNSKMVLIVGNERAGVDPGILAICDRIFYLPMYGYKNSLNVAVAFGIAAYYLRFSVHAQSLNDQL